MTHTIDACGLAGATERIKRDWMNDTGNGWCALVSALHCTHGVRIAEWERVSAWERSS